MELKQYNIDGTNELKFSVVYPPPLTSKMEEYNVPVYKVKYVFHHTHERA